MLWVILAHAALIELALIVLGTKPSDKGGGVEIHLSGKITPSDRPPQLTVATGSLGWLWFFPSGTQRGRILPLLLWRRGSGEEADYSLVSSLIQWQRRV
jgi:hypothetical protein